MGGKRRFDISQNVAKGFVLMQRDLEEIAKETDKSMIEIYDMFLSDLQNYYDYNYEKKLEEIELSGFSRESINKIYEHVSKLKKSLEERESKDKTRKEKERLEEEKAQEMKTKWGEIEDQINKAILDGDKGTEKEIVQRFISDINKPDSSYDFDNKTRKYIAQKLKGRVEQLNKREKDRKKQERSQIKQKNEDTKKVETAMRQIETIFEREHSKGKIKNKANYLIAVKDAIISKEKDMALSINIGEREQQQLLQLLDDRIKAEKDKTYFEQVRDFTDGFRFLKSFSETANAMYGAKKRKFTDIESYHRYSALRERLIEANNEYLQINKLLGSKKIDNVDRRILLARKEYMDRERENNKKIGEVR